MENLRYTITSNRDKQEDTSNFLLIREYLKKDNVARREVIGGFKERKKAKEIKKIYTDRYEKSIISKIIERFRDSEKEFSEEKLNVKLKKCKKFLNLRDLLYLNDFSFYHDMYGIIDYFDSRTNKFRKFFKPRCFKNSPTKKKGGYINGK